MKACSYWTHDPWVTSSGYSLVETKARQSISNQINNKCCLKATRFEGLCLPLFEQYVSTKCSFFFDKWSALYYECIEYSDFQDLWTKSNWSQWKFFFRKSKGKQAPLHISVHMGFLQRLNKWGCFITPKLNHPRISTFHRKWLPWTIWMNESEGLHISGSQEQKAWKANNA